jgi:Transglycosylase SLT domain
MWKWLAIGAALAVAFPLSLLLLVTADPAASLASTSLTGGPSLLALDEIPPAYLALYMRAAQTCKGLPWAVLAGIGTVESDNGQSNAPGVHSGANYAGAEGPMQFEPPTFAEYKVIVDNLGDQDIYDPADAIYTAAAMLGANGAASGTQAGIRQAIFAYCADVLVMPIWGGRPWWLAGGVGITRGLGGWR